MKKGQTHRQESWDWVGCAHGDGGYLCLLCRAGEARVGGIGRLWREISLNKLNRFPSPQLQLRCFVVLGGGICTCQFLQSVVSGHL